MFMKFTGIGLIILFGWLAGRAQIPGTDSIFKAGELTRLRDGETVLMRDTYGRPAWSGGYGRGVATTAGTAAAWP